MDHKYKVGDRVRNVDSGYIQEFGDMCNEPVVNGIVTKVHGDYAIDVKFDGCCSHHYCYNRNVEQYTEQPATTGHTASDAFRRIHASLDDAVNAMLAERDHEAAMKYAAMMHAIEQFTPKPAT